jgi:two-component system chemotaxis response regulator CheB
MAGHDIIVIGASMGGVQALRLMVQQLPADLPAALFIVLHLPASGDSRLPEVLNYRSALPAQHARDGEPIHHGRIYVAPQDYHLLLEPGHVHLSHGPHENHCRPAIDPLFRSAARAYRGRVIGVVLTGMLNDGTAGLLAVRNAGGVAIVQNPAEALAPGMPAAAMAVAGADYVLPLAKIVPLLTKLAHEPVVGGTAAMPGPVDPIDNLPDIVSRSQVEQRNGDRRGQVSIFTCPECGGSLWQVDQEQLVRFRCHVGHVYDGDQLLQEQSEHLEAALWIAVRTFIDKSVLARQLAESRRQQGLEVGVDRLEEEAQQCQHYAALIRQYLLKVPADPAASDDPAAEVPPPAAKPSRQE